MSGQLNRLLSAASNNDTAALLDLLREIVPEYTPTPNNTH